MLQLIGMDVKYSSSRQLTMDCSIAGRNTLHCFFPHIPVDCWTLTEHFHSYAGPNVLYIVFHWLLSSVYIWLSMYIQTFLFRNYFIIVLLLETPQVALLLVSILFCCYRFPLYFCSLLLRLVTSLLFPNILLLPEVLYLNSVLCWAACNKFFFLCTHSVHWMTIKLSMKIKVKAVIKYLMLTRVLTKYVGNFCVQEKKRTWKHTQVIIIFVEKRVNVNDFSYI